MKNVLFATTALVAMGGTAFAGGHTGITFGGSAEIGVFMIDSEIPLGSPGARRENDGDLRLHHDMDMDITFSGTTDNGLTFGADVDLDEISGGISSNAGPHTVFVSGAFGTLTIGDTDGAFDKALTEIAVGSTIADDPEHGGYSGNSGLDGLYDGQIARYDYAFGDLTFSVSVELDDDEGDGVIGSGLAASSGGGSNVAADGDPIFGVGVAWSGDFGGTTLGVGIGYQTVDVDALQFRPAAADNAGGAAQTAGVPTDVPSAVGTHEFVGASVTAGFGALTAIVNFTTSDRPVGFGDDDYIGVSLEYVAGDLTVGANWGENDNSVSGATDGFGVFASYALADGVALVAGYGSSETAGGIGTDRASVGLGLSF